MDKPIVEDYAAIAESLKRIEAARMLQDASVTKCAPIGGSIRVVKLPPAYIGVHYLELGMLGKVFDHGTSVSSILSQGQDAENDLVAVEFSNGMRMWLAGDNYEIT